MNERLLAPKTRRRRRSHAERTAETQGRIKAAVVEAVSDLGFHRTTAAEISRRAGVSWGGAQHHFGDKDGILTAVLVDSFNSFADRLKGIAVEGRSLAERVALFVEAAWEHFGSPSYRCTLEILLNMPAPDWVSRELPLRDATLEVWSGIWSRFFGEAELPPRHQIAVQYYAVSVLSGLAAMKRFEGPTAERRQIELRFLEETLVRELSPGSG
ncbi:MAG: TetR/AcrR family transcriptional regulator [bacterium]|nr:TetR/AcrR family transcriptional regulator [bacterium]